MIHTNVIGRRVTRADGSGAGVIALVGDAQPSGSANWFRIPVVVQTDDGRFSTGDIRDWAPEKSPTATPPGGPPK